MVINGDLMVIWWWFNGDFDGDFNGDSNGDFDGDLPFGRLRVSYWKNGHLVDMYPWTMDKHGDFSISWNVSWSEGHRGLA